jgi:uroporphyrinogen decarboxylase
MRIEEVKRRYCDRIAVIGNVDCSIVLPLLSEHDVVEVVKETIAKAAPGGGFVLSSSNSIHPGVKPENFLAMVKAAREYGRYPIPEEFAREYSTRDFYAGVFGKRSAA